MNNLKNKILNSTGISWITVLITFAFGFSGKLQDDISLKDAFKDYFLIGTALNNAQFSGTDTLSASLTKKHFNAVTAENVMKWGPIHPQKDKYNFEPADLFVKFGEKNNMFIVGHTLVWHAQTPRWVFQIDSNKAADRGTLLSRMKDHITTVAGRYKGKIKGWDVVNEALDEDGKLRQSQWMRIIGEDYISLAFQFAHEADPGAELYYNDYSLENKPKRDGAVKLIKDLQSKGIKIDGVGLQGHYKMDWPSPEQLDSTIKTFAGLGLKVHITELDIDVLPYKDISAEISLTMENEERYNPYKDGLPDSAQTSLAERYRDLFKVFVENKNTVERVTFWGVTDKNSWLNYWPIMGRKSYPLLFDREGKPKRAFYSVLKTAGINSNQLNNQ